MIYFIILEGKNLWRWFLNFLINLCSSYRTYDSFERRAGAAYGYKIDPNYWDSYDRRRGKFKIVIACIIWAFFGAFLQISVAVWRTDRDSKHMNAQTAMLNQQLLDMKSAAQKRGTWEEQKKQIRNKMTHRPKVLQLKFQTCVFCLF